MIQIKDIVKTYGKVRALDGLSLQVEPGMVYGFLGPNGAGKTTTMRILSGLARPDQGQAWILGKEIGLNGRDQRPMIGVLPEEPAFYSWMTAREYLRDFIAPLYGLETGTATRRADEMLEQVGLTEAADRRCTGFSRGMRQRLGLAQALIHQPKVLLLDEPVSALDPAGRKEVLELIGGLSGSGTTILLSTHILADVERVCDTIGIISKGKMITEDRREDLLERYALPLFEVEADDDLGAWPESASRLPFVKSVTISNHTTRVLVKDVQSAQTGLLASILEAGLHIRRFEIVHPSLEDIFLRLTEESSQHDQVGGSTL
jgi:ABC-2 type transport system ATP-binding protein